jgi:hypothetical protein
MAEPATKITDHRLPATMTPTRACVRPSPETQCLFIEALKPRSWEPNTEVLKPRSWEPNAVTRACRHGRIVSDRHGYSLVSYKVTKSVCGCVRRCSGSVFYGRTGHRDNWPPATSDHDSNTCVRACVQVLKPSVCLSESWNPGPEIQVLRTKCRNRTGWTHIFPNFFFLKNPKI